MSAIKSKKLKKVDIVPILICGCSVPISLFFWLGHLTLSRLWTDEHDEVNGIPPVRWLMAILTPLLMMMVALRQKSVNNSGAALGFVFACIMALANFSFFVSLATFFFSASRATKFRAYFKRNFTADFKEGGGRSWVQVLCNGGMATNLTILYLLDCGSGERAIDFARYYRSSWLTVAVISAFAGCNGDTWASELGSVLSRQDPYLLVNFKRVPRGTNGGVSVVGLVVSFLGGLVVGLGFYLFNSYILDPNSYQKIPPQWPIVLFAGFAGLFGSLVDSFLGALFQYSGIDSQGKIVHCGGEGVKHISGIRLLDNNSVNLIASIITAVSIPHVAMKFWPDVAFMIFCVTNVLLSTCEAATIKKQPVKEPESEGVWSTVAELATRVVRQLADDLSAEDSAEDDETNVKKDEAEAEAAAAVPVENDDDEEEEEEEDDDDDLGFFGRRVQRSVEAQKEQKEHKEVTENETETAAEAEPVKGSESAATPNFSVLILIRNALKKVTTNLPAEQVATNALHYFQLFEHFLQQTIEQVIDDVDDDKDDKEEETSVAATTIESTLAETLDKGTATEAAMAETETATNSALNLENNSEASEKQPELSMSKPMSMLLVEETTNEMSNNALTAVEMTTTVPSS